MPRHFVCKHLMEKILTAQIDGTFYANLHYALIKKAREHGLPTNSEETMKTLLLDFDLLYNFQFVMYPVMRQIIGKRPSAFDFDLVLDRDKSMRPVGGNFNPNAYVVAGNILRFSEVQGSQTGSGEEPLLNITLDCGIPIDLRQKKSLGKAPGIQSHDIKQNAWIAALGHLVAWVSEKSFEYSVLCKILGVQILDLNPASETFGLVIPWSFSEKAPTDADVMQIPVTFLSLQVLTDDV